MTCMILHSTFKLSTASVVTMFLIINPSWVVICSMVLLRFILSY
jgi:hypothetical protein